MNIFFSTLKSTLRVGVKNNLPEIEIVNNFSQMNKRVFVLQSQQELNQFQELRQMIDNSSFTLIIEQCLNGYENQLTIKKEELSPFLQIWISQEGQKQNHELDRVRPKKQRNKYNNNKIDEQFVFQLKKHDLSEILEFYNYSMPVIYGWHNYLQN